MKAPQRVKQYDDDALIDMLAARGLTHAQIAERLGISQSMVSRIARGQARKDLRARIDQARASLPEDQRRPQPRHLPKGIRASTIHEEYDDDLLVELIVDETASARQIARRVGISEGMVTQVTAGRVRLDLQPRIDAALRAKLRKARRSAAESDAHRGPVVRKGYDDELFISLVSRGDMSVTQIARRLGVNRSSIWRILTGRSRPDLQPRIREVVRDHRRRVQLTAMRVLGGLVSKHITMGMDGEGELARKCREFIIKLIWQDDDDDDRSYSLPTPGLTSEDYQTIAILKGGPLPEGYCHEEWEKRIRDLKVDNGLAVTTTAFSAENAKNAEEVCTE